MVLYYAICGRVGMQVGTHLVVVGQHVVHLH
jgi:hypothetical protein